MVEGRVHYSQIDVMKGIAIILVLLGHTFFYTEVQPQVSPAVITDTVALSDKLVSIQATPIPQIPDIAAFGLNSVSGFLSSFTKWITYSALSTQQVVPIFMVLMALNFSLSYRRRGYTKLSEIYTKNEFVRRFRRFFIPFTVCFIASMVIGIFIYAFLDKNVISISFYNLLGYLPINGPGNYFISLIFEFLLVFPLVYILYIRYPRLVVIGSFAAALLFELVAQHTVIFANASGYYSLCIIRFLPLLALSMWISGDWGLFSRRNSYILLLGIVSFFYLVVVNQPTGSFYLAGILFAPNLKSQLLFGSFYTVMLVILGMRYQPQRIKNRVPGWLSTIGKASYHIFLVQIMYFGVNLFLKTKYHSLTDLASPQNVAIAAMNLAICIAVGLLFYYLDGRIFSKIGQKPAILTPATGA